MKHNLYRAGKGVLKAILYATAGGFMALIVVFVMHLERRPDLKIWHHAELDAEFTAESSARTFEEYLAIETHLFTQLQNHVYARIAARDRRLINRYHRGSLADPKRWVPNWNRTFEFSADAPRAGILLLHGMSDSPYNLRSIGRRLHNAGAWVVGLRLPGHGTAPSGLVEVRWEDMAAAVRLAMRHLRDEVGNSPLYIVGYSNGGSLAVQYTLVSRTDPTLPQVKRLVLISPALGVTSLAALAVWQARIGHLFGLEKLAWNSILPEYDPFKYQSFAVNAGDQVYRLTSDIRRRFEKSNSAKEVPRFPPVLVFQSVADATVSVPAIVNGLFAQLPVGGHELVLFDINRNSEVERVLAAGATVFDPAGLINADSSFTMSLVTNDSKNTDQVVVLRKRPGESNVAEMPLALKWPKELYSLSHVALPIPIDDPLYGEPAGVKSPGIRLGKIAVRGERGVLQIPAADMLRLRWNPFYSYLQRRLIEFLHLGEGNEIK